MTCCIRCGSHIGELDHGGNMICQNCESSQGTDVPCQRCGMYLPPHELRMWNSRLYCAYCIMDLQDEEKWIRQGGRNASQGEGVGSHGGKGGLFPELGGNKGVCERCGREASTFYTAHGRRLCQSCYFEGESGESSSRPFGLSQIITKVKKLFNIRPEPKLVAAQKPVLVFDPATRKMVEKKNGLHSQKPLSEQVSSKEGEENARGKKKKGAKAKKEFFAAHPGIKKGK